MVKSKVAVLRTKPETVLADYKKLLLLAGVNETLDKTKTTILKDNISWHMPMPAANTTPWQLEGTIQSLNENGFNDIVAVQNKTVVTDAFLGEDLNKYVSIFKKYKIPVLFNFKIGEKEDMKWIIYKPKAKMLVLDKIFPEGIRIPDYFVGKNIVHLPTVKCHIYTTTTGAIKNAFGGLLSTKRHYTHSFIHETIIDLLAIQKEIHPGLFAVMDGTMAGNGPGPRTMTPEDKGIILASSDQVAIDAVAAKLMGFDPMGIKYIQLGTELGLGTGIMDEIEIVGDIDVMKENWHFEVGKNLVKRVGGDMFWFGPLKSTQKLFFRTPLVKLFIFASEIYHDKIMWPRKYNKIYKTWIKKNRWGKLFKNYE
ncbi:MAG: DUF362 domain-containing protein [bacterium]